MTQDDNRRSVGFLLTLGVFLLPWLCAWFLLRRGYSTLARSVGFGWLALTLIPVLMGIFAPSSHNASAQKTEQAGNHIGQVEHAKPAASVRTVDGGPQSFWTYDLSNDAMRGSTDRFASLESTNVRGYIQLRKSTQHGTDAMLVLDRAQFVCSFGGCSVSAKFDDGPIQQLQCFPASDGNTRTIFVGDAGTFIAKLKRSKHVFVEAEMFQAGSVQMEFATLGLDWK